MADAAGLVEAYSRLTATERHAHRRVFAEHRQALAVAGSPLTAEFWSALYCFLESLEDATRASWGAVIGQWGAIGAPAVVPTSTRGLVEAFARLDRGSRWGLIDGAADQHGAFWDELAMWLAEIEAERNQQFDDIRAAYGDDPDPGTTLSDER